MLYKFKSKVTGDLIMLEPNGRRILEIIGKSPDAQGIIQPLQMPMAIAAIEAAILDEEAQKARVKDAATVESTNELASPTGTGHDEVGLRQRAQPMLEMLRRCQGAEADIVWGV